MALGGIGQGTNPGATRRQPSSKRRALLISSLAGLLAEILSLPAYAQKLPTSPNVTSGNVNFSQPNTSTLNVNQSTPQAVINWQTFSVGRGDTVNFNQPGATSSTLNRVTSNTPSWIAGTINAPGTVLLVNPNGIAITKSGVINTGSFIASTLGISDQDYLNGKYTFNGNGSSARVVNNGHINVSDGGFAALLGGQVANNGVIVARLGKVGLGSGEQATIDLSGDGFLSVAVPTSQLGNLRDEQGKPLVSNSGKIVANGGSVYLSAATAANILRDAINVPGTIRANSVAGHDGAIYLGGGPGGTVTVSGHLSANGGRHHKGGTIQIAAAKVKTTSTSTITANGSSGGLISVIAADKLVASGKIQAKGKSGRGGEIDMTANHVALKGANIDASGASGGGNVNVGGGPHASVALANAQSVSIDSASTIRADATNNGNGGHIVVWSDQATKASSFFSATGGPNGGNGGYIEISSQIDLTMRGFADLSAPHGTIGTLLFDPGSINIVQGSNSYQNADTFSDAYLSAQLASASIIIDTNNATGANGSAGDITLQNGAAISWNAATTLTLNAAHDIVFNSGSSITTSGGSVALNAGNNASGSGTVRFNGSGNQITVSGGGSVNAYYNPSNFGTADFQTGSVSVSGGGALTAYMLVNNNGQLTAINNNLSGNYALAADLNFGTIGYSHLDDNLFYGSGSPNCAPCLEPLRTFNGKLDGRGHTITFTTYSTQAEDQGLFQGIGPSGVINNLNVNMTGYAGRFIGGIAGDNQGLIENSHASTTITLLGDPNNPLATGTLPTSVVGGLVGINETTGRIVNSSASVNTRAGVNDGGLVGVNRGTITNSSASGSISVGTTYNNLTDMGGLVGQNIGTITGSFASTNVNDYGNVNSNDGGFVGENFGTISSSFSTGAVTGGFQAGGFVGQNDVNAQITASFSTGRATAILGQDSAGFVGNNKGTISQSYSTGSAGSNRDGTTAFGFASANSGTLSSDYWDVTTSGLSTGVGSSGGSGASGTATAVQSSNPNASNYAYNASAYSSGFIGSAWYINDGFTRPLPIGLATNTITTSNSLLAAIQLELVGSAPNGNYALGTNIDLSVTSSSTLWGPRGFGPIGAFDNGQGAAFTGTFNGNGYTISNLNINATDTNYIGLFGQNAGTIENLGLVGGTIDGLQVVGSIAARNTGTITTSYATTTVEGGNNVGGLVGVNAGGSISDSYYIGTVTSGLNSSSGPAGGIAGLNYGTISRTYAAATVNGNGSSAGGLVGHNEQSSSTGSVTQSYWNTDLTAAGVGQPDPGTTFSAGGMTTAQMQDLNNFQSNFADFDFQRTWAPPNQAGQGGNATAYYPQLYADSHVIWIDPNFATTSYGTPATLTAQTYGLRNYDLPSVERITLSSTGGNAPNASSTPYAITGSGSATSTDGSSYRFITAGGTLTVNPLDLTGTATVANINKTYDGTTAAAGGAVTLTAANGVINGDTVTISVSSGLYANANVIGVESVTLNGMSISSGNYVIGNLLLTGTGSITPAQLTITGNKTYDTTTGFTTQQLTVAGGVNGETIALTAGSGITTAADAGTYLNSALAGPAFTVTGGNARASNYQLPTTGTLTIGKANYTAIAGSKTYDGGAGFTSGQVTLTGVGGQTFNVAATANSANAGSNTTGLGGAATNFIGIDSAITGLNGANPNNYNVLVVSSLTGSNNVATINKANYSSLTGSKTYDGNANFTGSQLTLTGVNGQTFSVASAIANSANASSNVNGVGGPASSFTSIGPITGLNSADANNYNAPLNLGSGTLATNQATINTASYTAISGTKTYDSSANFTSGQVTLTGVNGETFNVAALANSANASSNTTGVGGAATSFVSASGPITGLNGADANNYSALVVTSLTGAHNSATVNKANYSSLTGSKTYDGNANFTNSQLTLAGVNGQTFSVASAIANSANASSNVNGAGGAASSFTSISAITGLNGADTNNYNAPLNLGSGSLATNQATINTASYTAIAGSKTYDGSAGFASGRVTLTGVNGETFNVAAAANSANASSNTMGAGGAAMTFVNTSGSIIGLNGADANNYSALVVTNLTGANNAATINVASYTAIAGSKTYDGNANFSDGQVTLTGVNGEMFNVAATANAANASLNPNNAATNFVSTGTTITGLNGADPNNYGVPVVTNLTGAHNSATINKANYVSLAGSKTYDGNVNFSSSQLALSGVNGETFSVASAMANSANASSNLNGVGGPASRFTSVGAITGLNGADTNNYNAPLNLGSGTLASNQATINVASYTSIAGSKTYDSSANFTSGQVTLTGVNGETFNVAALANSANASSNPLDPASNFVSTSGPITGNGGADPNNYGALNVGAFSSANNKATVNPEAVTVTASSNTKIFDGSTSASATPTVTSGQFYGIDQATLSETYADFRSGVNLTLNAAVAFGSAAGAGNYRVAFVSNTNGVINPPAAASPSQVTGNPPSQQPSQTNFSFQAPTPQPVSVSFTTAITTPVRTANRNGGTQVANTNPADTTPTGALDLNFVPISQFDPTQYAGDTLPDYKYQAGQSTVFTMIARALKAAGKQPINDFWNNTTHNPSWPGNGNDKQIVKVSFSNGAGKTVAPTDANAFQIVPGTTDIPGLLAHGPVLIGSGSAPTVSWLLAFKLTGDGKGILANDPQTGKTLVLAYDPTTKAVGGVQGVFDLKQGGAVIPLAPTPAVLGDYAPGGAYPALQAFKPADYLAVSLN